MGNICLLAAMGDDVGPHNGRLEVGAFVTNLPVRDILSIICLCWSHSRAGENSPRKLKLTPVSGRGTALMTQSFYLHLSTLHVRKSFKFTKTKGYIFHALP